MITVHVDATNMRFSSVFSPREEDAEIQRETGKGIQKITCYSGIKCKFIPVKGDAWWHEPTDNTIDLHYIETRVQEHDRATVESGLGLW